jgi:hypothetical protein
MIMIFGIRYGSLRCLLSTFISSGEFYMKPYQSKPIFSKRESNVTLNVLNAMIILNLFIMFSLIVSELNKLGSSLL